MGYLFFYAERFLWVLWVLCEIYFCSHYDYFFTQRPQRPQSFIYLSYSTLALEWSQTSLRQECAESFIHPLPPAGYSRLSQGEKRTPPQPSPVWERVVTTDLCPISRTLYSPSLTGRARSSEEALNVLLCLGRGELSSSTRGLDGVGPVGPWVGPYSKNLYIPLCVLLGGEILVSSRLGPRMNSVWNMNSRAHDNMSALPRQSDGDDGCSKCTSTAPIFTSITH